MKKAVVSLGVGGVNVRKYQGVRSKLLDSLEPGHAVEISEESDGWIHHRYLRGDKTFSGWSVRSAFVIEPEEVPTEMPIAVPTTSGWDWASFIGAGVALVVLVTIFLIQVFFG